MMWFSFLSVKIPTQSLGVGGAFSQFYHAAYCIQSLLAQHGAFPFETDNFQHPEQPVMAKNTGQGSRQGAVDDRTQVKNPKTGDFVKGNQDPDSAHEGEFMDVKKDGKPFKGIAKEPDGRRKKSK